MNMQTIKKFVKEHKGTIIGGTIGLASAAALAVIGIKWGKPKLTDFTDSLDPNFLDFLKTADRIGRQSPYYTETSPEAIWAMFDKDGKLVDSCIKCDDGGLLCVENIIVFGHEVKSEP